MPHDESVRPDEPHETPQEQPASPQWLDVPDVDGALDRITWTMGPARTLVVRRGIPHGLVLTLVGAALLSFSLVVLLTSGQSNVRWVVFVVAVLVAALPLARGVYWLCNRSPVLILGPNDLTDRRTGACIPYALIRRAYGATGSFDGWLLPATISLSLGEPVCGRTYWRIAVTGLDRSPIFLVQEICERAGMRSRFGQM